MYATFLCPKHSHSVTLNGITSTAGPGEAEELSGIKGKLGGNDIRHRCFKDF